MSQHRDDDPDRPYFATAARGTEGVLRDELRELRIPRVKAARGGVHFGGDIGSALRVCLHSRIAVRVLERQASFEAPDIDALYEGVAAVPWERVLDGRRTLCVDALVRDAASTHSLFVAQRVKDAVVDRLRAKHGVRPDVSVRDPDVRIAAHWIGGQARLLLDVGGASLHARGFRAEAGQAPLRETLAAAVLRLSGWDRESALLDPMCGAGTIAIEAAQWARGIAPGLARSLGVERWASHDEAERSLLAQFREQGRAAARAEGPPVFARDLDGRAVELARRNAQLAGVRIEFARADVTEIEPLCGGGWVISNPPYGDRLAAPERFERELANALRRLRGHRVCLLLRDRALPRALAKKPVLEHQLWNGALECRLFGWQI